MLCVEVWAQPRAQSQAQGQGRGPGDFLGRVELSGGDLSRLIGGSGDGDAGSVFPLRTSNRLSPRGNKHAAKSSGSLTLSGTLRSTLEGRERKAREAEERQRRAIEADPSLQSSRLEVSVVSAEGLPRTSVMGKGSDTYVCLHWHVAAAAAADATANTSTASASTPGGGGRESGPAPPAGEASPLGDIATHKTRTVRQTTSPRYDNEHFLLDKPEGRRLRDCTLVLTVLAAGAVRDECIGAVVLSGEELVALSRRGKQGGGESVYEIAPFDATGSVDMAAVLAGTAGVAGAAGAVGAAGTPSLRQTFMSSRGSKQPRLSRPTGTLSVSARDIQALPPSVWDLRKPVPAGYREFELVILAGGDLPRANAFGLSDPFCVVSWGRREIGKTACIKETLDPVWEVEEAFTFRAPITLGTSERDRALLLRQSAVRELRARRQREEENDPLGLIRKRAAEAAAPLSEEDEINAYLLSVPQQELTLTIDVFDWNAVAKGVFLGSVELRGPELDELCSGRTPTRKWVELAKTNRLPLNAQGLAGTTGRLEVMLGAKVDAAAQFDGREVDLEICSAKGLKKADTFGLADPYVKIRWNNKVVGKTVVVRNTLTPVWEQAFLLSIPGHMTAEHCSLYLEVTPSFPLFITLTYFLIYRLQSLSPLIRLTHPIINAQCILPPPSRTRTRKGVGRGQLRWRLLPRRLDPLRPPAAGPARGL